MMMGSMTRMKSKKSTRQAELTANGAIKEYIASRLRIHIVIARLKINE